MNVLRKKQRLHSMLSQNDDLVDIMNEQGYVCVDDFWQRYYHFSPKEMYDDRFFTFDQDEQGRMFITANFGHTGKIFDKKNKWLIPLESDVDFLYMSCVNLDSLGIINCGHPFNILSREDNILNKGYKAKFNVSTCEKNGRRFWKYENDTAKRVYCFEPLTFMAENIEPKDNSEFSQVIFNLDEESSEEE